MRGLDLFLLLPAVRLCIGHTSSSQDSLAGVGNLLSALEGVGHSGTGEAADLSKVTTTGIACLSDTCATYTTVRSREVVTKTTTNFIQAEQVSAHSATTDFVTSTHSSTSTKEGTSTSKHSTSTSRNQRLRLERLRVLRWVS